MTYRYVFCLYRNFKCYIRRTVWFQRHPHSLYQIRWMAFLVSSYNRQSNYFWFYLGIVLENSCNWKPSSIEHVYCATMWSRVTPVFHLVKFFPRTEKTATWLAGDNHSRHHHPITFVFSKIAREKKRLVENAFHPML
jgi:hypothetical protein